jgi:hypothetical protein
MERHLWLILVHVSATSPVVLAWSQGLLPTPVATHIALCACYVTQECIRLDPDVKFYLPIWRHSAAPDGSNNGTTRRQMQSRGMLSWFTGFW